MARPLFFFALLAVAGLSLAQGSGAASAPSAVASASTKPFGWLQGEQQGWFWYLDPPAEEEAPPEEPLPPAAPPTPPPVAAPAAPATPAEPAPLSAAWIRANMQVYLDRATDSPTPENVQAYLLLQRLAMDKSSKFSDVSRAVMQGNPMLDESARRPLATFGAMAASTQAAARQRQLFHDLSRHAGIWYFYRSDCSFCAQQGPVLKSIEDAYGMSIIPISLDGGPPPSGSFKTPFKVDSGQGAMLNVQGTPALFLVRPGSKTIIPLAQGIIAQDELVDRVLIAAHAQQWISDQDFQNTRPFKSIGPEVGSPEYEQIVKARLQPTAASTARLP